MNLSISKIKSFKSCRRKFKLKYIEGLTPNITPDSLEVGRNYHSFLEKLNNGENLADNPDYEGVYSKELAMARTYEKFIWPQLKVVEAEKRLELDLGDGDTLVGIADGIAEDGCLVEYKTTGSEITEQYEFNLQWDEQILAYMLMTGARKIYYVVCRKPTIRQKQNETEKEFFYRMLEWYETDTDKKIRLMVINRTDDEVAQFEKDLNDMRVEMKDAKTYYRNTCHCTAWGGRCEYSSICLHYDPNQEYVEFTKKEA